eukprot:13306833-Alexandrium_andersonii.AAC.1
MCTTEEADGCNYSHRCSAAKAEDWHDVHTGHVDAANCEDAAGLVYWCCSTSPSTTKEARSNYCH